MTENCGNCRYFNKVVESYELGTCHRNPPDQKGNWSQVYNDEYCGEYQKIDMNTVINRLVKSQERLSEKIRKALR